MLPDRSGRGPALDGSQNGLSNMGMNAGMDENPAKRMRVDMAGASATGIGDNGGYAGML